MASSVSPSEATPLIRNGNGYDNDGSEITATMANDTNGTAGKESRRSSFLRMSLHRSMSTFTEAVTSMKRIGYLGSMSISVNSLTGPAM
ncbi:MAG: hypothetical protein SGILL_003777 [Bacillariaceae sp.]